MDRFYYSEIILRMCLMLHILFLFLFFYFLTPDSDTYGSIVMEDKKYILEYLFILLKNTSWIH